MGTLRMAKALVFLLLLFFVSPYPMAAAQGGKWVERKPTPYQGGLGEAVVGAGDYIYAIRAHSTGRCYFWIYSPSTDAWKTILEWNPDDPIPRPKSGTALAWDGGNNIYALLGAAYGENRY
ncbi:MAG: hypothetical protein QXL35_04980, partial [Candidatus Bathyarchaeia archaeon]